MKKALDIDAAETVMVIVQEEKGGRNMEYSIRQLADLTGVSTRTLRYYDERGLLKPSRVNEQGCRYYEQEQVDLLQQILFYRERNLGLDVIKEIINNPRFDAAQALEEHLIALIEQEKHISALIQTVKNTIADMKGERSMSDKEKFEGFKRELIEKKEKLYGKEAREKYGEEAVDEANQKIMGLSEADYERFKNLEKEVCRQLEEAVRNKELPESETGHRIVLLHKDWLGYTWKEYSAQAHKGLASMYIEDERFLAYYDKNLKGCGEFLVKAVNYWAGR